MDRKTVSKENRYFLKDLETLSGEELKALQFKKRVVVPYLCTSCQHEATEWSGRCRRCGNWNTFVALPWLEGGQTITARESSLMPPRAIPYQGIASPFETV